VLFDRLRPIGRGRDVRSNPSPSGSATPRLGAEEVQAVQVRPRRQDAPAHGRPAPDVPDVGPWRTAQSRFCQFCRVPAGPDDGTRPGLFAPLARRPGSATGITNIQAELAAKRLEILKEIVPIAKRIAVIVNPDNPNAPPQMRHQPQDRRAISLGCRTSWCWA
jgi:hypothetical protein